MFKHLMDLVTKETEGDMGLFEDIPNEIIERIILQLDVTELSKLCATSKAFQRWCIKNNYDMISIVRKAKDAANWITNEIHTGLKLMKNNMVGISIKPTQDQRLFINYPRYDTALSALIKSIFGVDNPKRQVVEEPEYGTIIHNRIQTYIKTYYVTEQMYNRYVKLFVVLILRGYNTLQCYDVGCSICGNASSLQCGGTCINTIYCTIECQSKDWDKHQNICGNTK